MDLGGFLARVVNHLLSIGWSSTYLFSWYNLFFYQKFLPHTTDGAGASAPQLLIFCANIPYVPHSA